jgi:hypothetical protein
MYTPCQEDQVATFCSSRASQWKGVMEKVEQNDGFNFEGMYVTEFAGWWQGCQSASDPQGIQGQAMVARVCTKELIKAPRMTAFAWFNDFGGSTQPGSSDLWNNDDSLSPIGKAYLEALGHFSSNGSITTESPMTSDSGFNGSTTESPTDSGSTTDSPMTTHATGYNGSTDSESNNGNTGSESTTENPGQNTTGAPTVSQGDSTNNNVDATGIQCFKDTDCPMGQSCRHMGHAWGVCVLGDSGEQVLIL